MSKRGADRREKKERVLGGSFPAADREDLTASAAHLFQRALALHREKNFPAAEKIYRDILASNPRHFDALHMLGVINSQRKNFGEAVKFFDLAAAIQPDNPVLHFNQGNARREAGLFEEAVGSFSLALQWKPEFPAAWMGRARTFQKLSRHDKAASDFSHAIQLAPENASHRREFADFLTAIGRKAEAAAQLEAALALEKSNPCGGIVPRHISAPSLKSGLLQNQNSEEESLALAREILSRDPECAAAHKIQADIYRNTSRLQKALESYELALKYQPDFPEAHYGRGIVLQAFKRYEEALLSYEQAARLHPLPKRLLGRFILCRLMICDWKDLEKQKHQLLSQIQAGQHATTPFAALSIIQNSELLLKCNKLYINDLADSSKQTKNFRKKSPSEKIRVGYFSSDFRNHPVSQLIVGLLENHDRSRFETIGIDICPARGDETTRRIAAALDHFEHIGLSSPQEAISRSESLELDIAIDLNGLTFGAKPQIFANRVAPIQVNYLGFPGTSGASFYDYLIGDRVVIPEGHFHFYTEKIAYLPGSYLPNDSRKEISKITPTREEAGLPQDGMVFCCFNNSYKISPDIFRVWMRILKSVEGSVLWLSEMNSLALRNLSREAEAAGVNSDRLVFAPRTPRLADHLARHRLADLFLDTLHYNAHTTASDSLWAGVPVLTCLGESFAGRVASSLLHAIDLPELICSTTDQYEEIAIDIARDPQRLTALKKKLRQNRFTKPLFHSRRFARNMEDLYLSMWTRYQKGLPPAHIPARP